MLAALLALSVAPFPNGAYAMPEPCRALTAATSTPHLAEGTLRDYPVFVATKSGDPARVRRLVAAALHAEWKEEDGKLRLVAVRPTPDEDFPEFERQFRLAFAKHPAYAQLPPRDLYRMPAGSILRYGPSAGPLVRPLPPSLAKPAEGAPPYLMVLRMGPGIFQMRAPNSEQAQFASLPPSVEKALEKNLTKVVLTPEMRQGIGRGVHETASLKIDWKNLEKRDPVAARAESILPPVAKALSVDLALPLTDFSMFAVMAAAEGSGTVRSILEPYCMTLNWAMVDGALVGQLAMSERLAPAQSKRSVVTAFVAGIGAQGVINASDLSRYVANQCPGASESWSDVFVLAHANIIVDQSFVGDYPYNSRLYARLTPNDWARLRTGNEFLASDLSPGAQQALRALLVQAWSRTSQDAPDPARWRSLAPRELALKAAIEEESVLIGFTSIVPSVDDVKQSAGMFDYHRKRLGRDPLYQPALRRKFKLTITSHADEESVETGFSEVIPDENRKPAPWTSLPADTVRAFREAMEQSRRRQEVPGGQPPPT